MLRTPETVHWNAEQPCRGTTAGDSIGRENPRKGVGSEQLGVWNLRVDVYAREEAS